MTYARFLALFVLPPLAWAVYRARHRLRAALLPLGLLLGVVYAVTSPWDNAAVAHGLWSFGAGKTWGVTLGWLPLEEYAFFGLQTVAMALFVERRMAGRR